MGEICCPFLIDLCCRKILLEQILKLLMLYAALISRSFLPHNRAQSQFCVHVLMNRQSRKLNAFACQINLHPAVPGNAIGFMVYGLNLTQDVLFSGIFFCPPVFSAVVISIWINSKTPQQPPNAEQIPMFIDESICL